MSDDLTVDAEGTAASSGMDRRTFVRRAAVTGALAWAAPSITSMPAAFAAGSEICRLTVDEFEDPTALTASGGSTVKQVTAASAGFILGGERDVELTVAGAEASFDIATGSAVPGQAVVTAGPNTTSVQVILTWDGADDDPDTLGGFTPYDLTDGGSADRFLLSIGNIDSNDTNQAVIFKLTVHSTTGSHSVSKTENPGAARTLDWGFNDFTDVGVDMTNVTAIQLQTNSGAQTDPFYFTLRVCYIN